MVSCVIIRLLCMDVCYGLIGENLTYLIMLKGWIDVLVIFYCFEKLIMHFNYDEVSLLL